MVDVHLGPRNDGFSSKFKRSGFSDVREFSNDCGMRGQESSNVQIVLDSCVLKKYPPPKFRERVTVTREFPNLPCIPVASGGQIPLSKMITDEKCEMGIPTATCAFIDVKKSNSSMAVDNEQCKVASYEMDEASYGMDDYQKVTLDSKRGQKRGEEEYGNVHIVVDSHRLLIKYPPPKFRKGVTVTREFPNLSCVHVASGGQLPLSKMVRDEKCEMGIPTATSAFIDVKKYNSSMAVDNEQCKAASYEMDEASYGMDDNQKVRLDSKRGQEESGNVHIVVDSHRLLNKYPPPKFRKGVTVTREFPNLPCVHVASGGQLPLSKMVRDEKCEMRIPTATSAFIDVKKSNSSMAVNNDQCKTASYKMDDYQKVGMGDERDKVPSFSKQSHSFIVCEASSDEKCIDSQVVIGNDLAMEDDMARMKVEKVIHRFQEVVSDLSRERNLSFKLYLEASRILYKEHMWINVDKRLGPIEGVRVGDYFERRAELNIIGLHRQDIHGIDYMESDGRILAISIVNSGRYENSAKLNDPQEFPEVIIYSGEGGNRKVSNKTTVEDQDLKRGNLALKNSADAKNPIRVILKVFFESSSWRSDENYKFVYYGLYFVHSYWKERASSGKLVFYFKLHRFLKQPKVGKATFVRQPKLGETKLAERKLVSWVDVSQGKEKIPIRAINELDDERLPSFSYLANVSYPESCYPLVPNDGCACIDGCSDSEDCLCAIKNGGEIPYSYEERILMMKPLIVECGPSCKCFTSCLNRVSQRGIRFDLEVFKTKTKGWGVRSRSSIPRGGFICEYTGKIFGDKEVEKRICTDEYLFDIGNNYGNHSFRDKGILSSALKPSSDVSQCFTIDAAQLGNVARFINHSCSPNLFAQNVLFDHGDKRMPHVMLFASEDIPPLKELSYDYSYKIGEVCHVNGNGRWKTCHCGSEKCKGIIYY